MPDIRLYGPITSETAVDVREQIEAAGPDEELVVRIDSPGGSVFAGTSIVQALNSAPNPKRAIVESAAFSIASYILMCFDDVEIAENGYVMIHNPMITQTGGDAAKLQKDVDLLNKLRDTIVEAYVKRTGLSSEDIIKMLDDETYMNATEAKKFGFATRISGSKASAITNFEMPAVVACSLKVSEPAGGDDDLEPENSMSDQTPVAATPAEIREAFPAVAEDAAFILACVEDGLTIDACKTAFEVRLAAEAIARIEALEAENADLKAQLEVKNEEPADEPKEEEGEEPSETEEPSEEAPADEKEEEVADEEPADDADVKAAASSNEPIATGDADLRSSKDKWDDAIKQFVADGKSKLDAVKAVDQSYPGLRVAMLTELQG